VRRRNGSGGLEASCRWSDMEAWRYRRIDVKAWRYGVLEL